MFSCCRANAKQAKKDKHKKSTDGEQIEPNKQLVIPTITIENGGKSSANDNDDNVNAADDDGVTPAFSGSDNGAVKSAIVAAESEAEGVQKGATWQPDTAEAAETVAAEIIAAVVSAQGDRNTIAIVELDQSEEPSKASLTTTTTTTTTTSSSYSPASPPTPRSPASSSPTPNAYANGTDTSATPPMLPVDIIVAVETHTTPTAYQNPRPHQPTSHTPGDHTHHNNSDGPPKSCLSRHNSTHHSIKKKVNISSFAEIIEPDPLPPPPYDHASMAEDDDVFSDSLPPPKRESMCAPYLERDDGVPDSVLFGHGLPEWFNDERINDIGCIEPPVTPVGRDELELKRQRLYTDLLRAAHAAVEHSVRFTPLATDAPLYSGDARSAASGDCDPDLKPSVTENLEHLVNRLEKLVERLERSISARELEIANRTFDTVLERKRESFDLESAELPPLPVETYSDQLSQQTDNLQQRIERIETSLNKINDRHSSSVSASLSQNSQQKEGSLDNIPTVLDDYQLQVEEDETETETLLLPPPPSMSVLGYQDIISGPLSQYLTLSAKIGGDVAKHAELVKSAFNAQLQYVTLATQCAQPSQDKQFELLKPTSSQISAIQDYREKNRASPYFNHLSAISESIPALGWVCVSPTPGPHVKEMNDAGQFYTNRVLKEWKEKSAAHVEWARAWVQTLTELQAYIKQYHTTGLVWSGKGGVPAGAGVPPPPPIGSCPPPPPPPAFDLSAMSLEGGSADERSALFAQINQGEGITRNLKKVTDDMQTHKNPTLRTGPAPFKTPAQFGGVGGAPHAPVVKEPVFTRDGKKWIIEHQKNNARLLVENAEMNNVVYMFKCEGSTLTVKGKVNNIVLDSCKKCSLLFDSVVASIEFVNCQSVQMQVLGFVPTVSIDKTDGCQMYLTKESLGVEIVSSKSSEMNVVLPEANGDYTELALPEQFKTTISGKTLKTVCVDSLG